MNPNSKIPTLMDYSEQTPLRVFESGAILLYLAYTFGTFLPKDRGKRTEALNWLFWQMGSTPNLRGGFGHFYAYAPVKIKYAIDRYSMEVKRQLDVLDRQLADNQLTSMRPRRERILACGVARLPLRLLKPFQDHRGDRIKLRWRFPDLGKCLT